MRFIFSPTSHYNKKTTQDSLWIIVILACKQQTAEAAQSQITNDQGRERDRQPAREL
jgi:hypothetical protein